MTALESGKSRWRPLKIAALVVGVLVILGGVKLVNTGGDSGSGPDTSQDEAASGELQIVGGCSAAPPSTVSELAVVGMGAFHEPGSRVLWFGAVVENSDHRLAYQVAVTFILLDENCDPIPDTAFVDPVADSERHQVIPLIAGDGMHSGLGGSAELSVAATDIRLGGVSVQLTEPTWVDPEDPDPEYLSNMVALSRPKLTANGNFMALEATLWSSKNSVLPVGLSLVYVDNKGRIVGGAPVTRGDVDDVMIGSDSVTATFDRPVVDDPPANTNGLPVEVTDSQQTRAYVYPEAPDDNATDTE